MEQQADISMFESLQGADLCFSGMGVFQADTHIENAVFKETRQLTDAEKADVKKLEDEILKAEQEFRTKDNADLQKQRQCQQKLDNIQQELDSAKKKLNEVQTKRSKAYTEFEIDKFAFETPLKAFGVTVRWNEPKVDKTSINIEV